MSLLLRIAERALNRPLLIHPDKVPLILGVLEGRIPVETDQELRDEAQARIAELPEEARAVLTGPSPEASRFVGESVDTDPLTGQQSRLPYRRTKNGIAVITVTGSLVNRGAWIGSYSGSTSYEGIKHQVAVAAADPRTRAILLDIESPGGEAVGAFETAHAVRAADRIKPVHAVVNGMAASAAYAIAAGARRIVTGPSGIVGSIGVVMVHADYSRAIDKRGITPTLIFAGAHKVDGHPFGPLPESARDGLQAEVDRFYDLFVGTVAQLRDGLDDAAIRATEARTFLGADAVDVGLADELGTFEEVLADLSRGGSRSTTVMKGSFQMTQTTSAPAAETAGIPKAEHDLAVAAARTDGHAAGAKAERERFAAILADDKVKGRERTALDLALKSPDMAAADVIGFVAGLDIAQPAAAVPSIESRMAGQGTDLALGGPVQTGAPRQAAAVPSAASVYAARRKAMQPTH